MRLSPEKLELLPSDEDVRFYREHGWYVSKKIIPEWILDEAMVGTERFYEGERDWYFPSGCESVDWKPEDGPVLRHSSYLSLQSERIRRLVRLPIIGTVASVLADTPEIRLFRDTLIYKPPAEGSIDTAAGWHTDRAYWLMCSSEKMLTAFIPLHDCDEDMGPLTVLDGSHRWPVTRDMRTFHEQEMDSFLEGLDTGGQAIVKVTLALKKGQVSFHHNALIHGSYPNFTDRPRVCVTVHLQDETNSYQRAYDSEGKLLSHANDALCRKLESGFPDYRDPRICPVLWRQDES